MKKLFTLFAAAMAILSAQATDYTGKLTVSLNGYEASSSTSTISIDKADDGTYTLQLKNFVLGEEMPVGTISISGVAATDLGTATLLQTAQSITIEDGDTEGVDGWLGPMLGPVPVEMIGKLEGDDFHTVINIEFEGVGDIAVEFGDGYQLPNSGFENYHDISNYNTQEADGWHMFYSGTGTFYTTSATMFKGRTNYSAETRPGSLGEKSLVITSYKVPILNIIANGTVTTGRLMVGAASTDTSKNYSFNNLSLTDTDGNGDPFYASVNNLPDSLTVWVKFKQGTAQSEYKYASVSALLNDGNECRDPENTTYAGGIVAKAANTTIESLDGAWQRLSIPFYYDSYTATTPKALLVTLSTNATAGKGSDKDSLYIDDIALIYNGKLASLKYNGSALEGFEPDTEEYTIPLAADEKFSLDNIEALADGHGAYVVKTIEDFDEETGEGTASIRVVSADLKTITDYYINFTETTGINAAETTAAVGKMEVFNAAGQRIDAAAHGLNIIRQNGKTIKVIKK